MTTSYGLEQLLFRFSSRKFQTEIYRERFKMTKIDTAQDSWYEIQALVRYKSY